MNAAKVLEQAAQRIEAMGNQTVLGGIVLGSGLSRLLNRLKAPGAEPYMGDHDTRIGDKGFPERTAPDATKTRQLKLDSMRPFGVISAFRPQYTLKQNMGRSAKLLSYINNLLDRPGAYKLIGHWADPTDAGKELPYKDAAELGLIGKPAVEESYLVVKPDGVELADFESSIVELGRWFDQTGVLVHDGTSINMIEPQTGAKFSVGTGLVAPLMPIAYSRMRDQRELPFVFAGTQQPVGYLGVQLFGALGIQWVGGPDSTGPNYSDMFVLTDGTYK